VKYLVQTQAITKLALVGFFCQNVIYIERDGAAAEETNGHYLYIQKHIQHFFEVDQVVTPDSKPNDVKRKYIVGL